jgi:hypothetical protein
MRAGEETDMKATVRVRLETQGPYDQVDIEEMIEQIFIDLKDVILNPYSELREESKSGAYAYDGSIQRQLDHGVLNVIFTINGKD